MLIHSRRSLRHFSRIHLRYTFKRNRSNGCLAEILCCSRRQLADTDWWCNTAPASGPIREIILDKANSLAPGFWSDQGSDKKGRREFQRQRASPRVAEEPSNKRRRNSTGTGCQPCPSPLHLLPLKLSLIVSDLLVAEVKLLYTCA
ncbi:hypothetical protein TNCV_2874421 [Trichonephila clavipes]|nr:hypothetical protein TNCV_2874421 [Trichonephila clavipes]